MGNYKGLFTFDIYNHRYVLVEQADSIRDMSYQPEEEPENFYIVEQRGTVGSRFRTGDEYEKMFKEIGNYFETREEAEKAVEKLKALTEAKEDGLKIKGYYYNHEDLVILADIGKCNKLTLDTLFGKEID